MSKELRAEAERRLGHRIAGKYHLRDVLGVGGMGVVYAAWHQFTERMVALKLLHANIARTHTHAQRFLQEATASGAIGHPCIAEALDAGRDEDGCLYVAFELLKGEDLGAAIVAGRASPQRVLEVAEEVLSALSAAHNEGFIHRDIKPANIFLLDEPKNSVRSKLLDFGIARRVRASGGSEGLTQAGAVVGTPYYMSPEQMCGEAVDGRADLWALAVVIYYGLTGDLPFQGRSYVALLTEMLRRGPPSLPSVDAIPRGAEAILKRALAPRIEDRFQSAGSMRIAISGILPSSGSSDVTDRVIPEKTMPLSRRAQTPLTPQDPNISTRGLRADKPEYPTKAEPPWRRALEDIEGEISKLRARQPTVSKPEPTSALKKPPKWFRRK
ncbi:MAG: serine/threonine-protein kinase [Myxococcota bacterium]